MKGAQSRRRGRRPRSGWENREEAKGEEMQKGSRIHSK